MSVTQLLYAINSRFDAEWLRDRAGVLNVIDFRLRTAHGETTVRSGWIVRVGEDFPRLTTCFVKKERP